MSHVRSAIHLCLRLQSVFALALLFGLIGGAQAQSLDVSKADNAFGRFMATTTGAGQSSVSFGSGGTVLASPSSATLTADGSASLTVSRTATMLNPSGNPIPITTKAAVTAAALAPVIKKAIGLLPAISTGVALYEIAKEVGFTLGKSSSGAVTVTRADPTKCYIGPCYVYAASIMFYLDGWYLSDPVAAVSTQCSRIGFPAGCSGGGVTLPGGFSGEPNWFRVSVNYVEGGQSKSGETTVYRFSVSPDPVGPEIPSTLAELADAIASKSGWPSTSHIAQAAAQALATTGDKVATSAPTVSGPATSEGVTTTTLNSDGTKQTSSVTYNHNYAGNTITTGATTTNNTYNTQNQITNTTTVKSTPAAAPDPQKTDCEKTPDAIGCSEYGAIPDSTKVPNKSVPWTFAPVSFAGGTCPAPVTFSIAGPVAGSYQLSYNALCEKLVYVKGILLLMAAATAAFIMADSFKV